MMTKLLFLLLTVVCLPTASASGCGYGCYCIDDGACAYYCQNNMCQNQLPYGSQCTGYYVHPHECGSLYYCDSTSYPYYCKSLKSEGDYCTTSYSCLSNYCDSSTSTCRYYSSYFIYTVPIAITCVVSTVIFVLVVVLIVRLRRQRRLALAAYRVPCTVVPTPVGVHSSYHNPCLLGEGPPPKYPGRMNPVASPSSYQNPRPLGEAPYSEYTHQVYPRSSAPSYPNANFNDDSLPPAYSGPGQTNAGPQSYQN